VRKLFSLVGAIALVAIGLHAQAPLAGGSSSQVGLVVGSGNFFSPIVSDLDRAVAFYRDGLGFEVNGEPNNADANAPLRHMFGLPEAQIRWTVARPPAMRTGVEIVQIEKAARRPADRRIQDAGAFTLIVLVRDLDTAMRHLTAIGVPVISRGGTAVSFAPGAARGALVKDPDGHFVELFQPDPLPETATAATANVLGVRVRLTVGDVERSMRLYRDALGLQQNALGGFVSDRRVMDMLGLATGQYRLAASQVPGSGLTIEFIEFKGIDRRSVRAAIQDPGSTRMQLQVRDVDAAIAELAKAGGAVVSSGGTTVALPGRGGSTTNVAIVRDPDNLFLVLLQAPPR
jgi:catechol 2,3-dioxygenase-like lactoylglutathione lyase family enzyme